MSTDQTKRRRRSAIPIELLALTLLLFPAIPSVAGGSGETTSAEPAAITEGRVDYFEGRVSVNGEDASLGMAVETGDTVTTGVDSVADIVFGQKNLFRLDENTTARLTFSPETQGVRLEKGTFSAVFDELVTASSNGDSRFLLETNTAVAGIRGTTFFVKVESEDSTFICTCHGTLALEPQNGGDPFNVTNYKHEAYRFRRSDDQVIVEPEADLYHSSDDLNKLADRIGVTIPWGEAPDR